MALLRRFELSLAARGVAAGPLLAALVIALALPAAPAAASGYDLPIGGALEVDEDPPAPEPEEDDAPRFFDEDIPTTSQSVIYVVDRSSSMSLPARTFTGLDGEPVSDGTRLDMVKVELTRSIRTLSDNFSFNIVIYSECVDSWRPARVDATPAAKTAAIAWVNSITPWGWTNTGGATSRALLDRDNKVVMLLSDGAPNFLDCAQTYVGDFETHRRMIRSANTQAAVVHGFGIGLDPETRAFMMQVAADNGGSFRELD